MKWQYKLLVNCSSFQHDFWGPKLGFFAPLKDIPFPSFPPPQLFAYEMKVANGKMVQQLNSSSRQLGVAITLSHHRPKGRDLPRRCCSSSINCGIPWGAAAAAATVWHASASKARHALWLGSPISKWNNKLVCLALEPNVAYTQYCPGSRKRKRERARERREARQAGTWRHL